MVYTSYTIPSSTFSGKLVGGCFITHFTCAYFSSSSCSIGEWSSWKSPLISFKDEVSVATFKTTGNTIRWDFKAFWHFVRKKKHPAESRFFFFSEFSAKIWWTLPNLEVISKPPEMHVILNFTAQIITTFATGEMLRCHYYQNTRDFEWNL